MIGYNMKENDYFMSFHSCFTDRYGAFYRCRLKNLGSVKHFSENNKRGGGAQNKVQEGGKIFGKINKRPPCLFWTQEYDLLSTLVEVVDPTNFDKDQMGQRLIVT